MTRWTTSKPTVEGYYWWKDQHDPAILRVLQTSRGLCVDQGGIAEPIVVRIYGGQFYGPLTTPSEGRDE